MKNVDKLRQAVSHIYDNLAANQITIQILL